MKTKYVLIFLASLFMPLIATAQNQFVEYELICWDSAGTVRTLLQRSYEALGLGRTSSFHDLVTMDEVTISEGTVGACCGVAGGGAGIVDSTRLNATGDTLFYWQDGTVVGFGLIAPDAVTDAENGLSITGNTVRLGGALDSPTGITTTNTNFLTITDADTKGGISIAPGTVQLWNDSSTGDSTMSVGISNGSMVARAVDTNLSDTSQVDISPHRVRITTDTTEHDSYVHVRDMDLQEDPTHLVVRNETSKVLERAGVYDVIDTSVIATIKALADTADQIREDLAGGGGSDCCTQLFEGSGATNSVNWEGIAFGETRFVAVGDGGTGTRIQYTQDGLNWFDGQSVVANGWEDVAYGNGRFVAVANSGTGRVAYSDDGISWQELSTYDAYAFFTIAFGNGRFVALGINSTVDYFVSTDGVNWTVGNTGMSVNLDCRDMEFGLGLFAGMGYDTGGGSRQPYYGSADGTTWTLGTFSGPGGINSEDTYFDGTQFVATGIGAFDEVATSLDGITWSATQTDKPGGAAVRYKGVNYIFSRSTVAGDPNFFTSSLTWNTYVAQADTIPKAAWQEAATGNGIAVVVADGSGFAISQQHTAYIGDAVIDGDDWGRQVVVTDYTLVGFGTAESPLSVAGAGGGAGGGDSIFVARATNVQMFEEFFGSTVYASHGWTNSPTGSATTVLNPINEATAVGTVNLRGHATNTFENRLTILSNLQISNTDFELEIRMRSVHASFGSAGELFWFGFSRGTYTPGGTPADGIGFVMNSTGTVGRTDAAGATTVNFTNDVSTTYVVVRIVYTQATTTAEFFVNGVSQGTSSTNIPSNTDFRLDATYLTPTGSIGTTAANGGLIIDYVYMKKAVSR